MMLRTELTLRTAAIGCRLQPSISSPCTYHTAVSSSRRSKDAAPSQRRPTLIKTASAIQSSQAMIRHSTTVPSPSSTDTASTRTTKNPLSREHLDWNTFFALRKSRRRLQLGSSIGTSLASMVGGAQGLAMSDMDAIVGQIPLDPFITLGLITFGCGGVGWLLGPIVGTGIFNTMNRKYVGQMALKEKEFYSRIKKYRVDPAASSMANPVPDYYGEKISSVKDYRQWLKDQRAFNKKRQIFV